jgi:ribose-phosphate pyrophosphokinase
VEKLKVFAGNHSKRLASEVCSLLSIELGRAKVVRFNDGEVSVQYEDGVRGEDVFIVNSTSPPAENFLELCFMADAARGASAKRITAVIPYFGYARQDRKDRPRVPIAARTMAHMLSTTGINRVLLIDLHSEQTMGFFDPNVISDHLYGSITMVPYLREVMEGNFVVASPDKGGTARATAYAARLSQADIVIFDKRRAEAGKIEEGSIKIIGDVEGRDVLLVDDMIDSGGTVIADAKAAKEQGAKRIFVCATHGVFSRDAVNRLVASPIDKVIVTDSIERELTKAAKKKIIRLSIAPLLAQAIRKIHEGESLSQLIS